MSTPRQPPNYLGKWAETVAEKYLLDNGLILIQRNFFTKMGEIDLIMQDHNTLVFIEVRYRKNSFFGGPLASVTKQKQTKLVRTAEYYLVCHQKYAKMPSRFDIVGISNTRENPNVSNICLPSLINGSKNWSITKSIEWIKNAFEV